MKRASKTKKAKVPPRLIPIVDAVVEGVFARLAEAAAKAKQPAARRGSARAKDEPTAESHGGLASAIADLLLATLTREASKPKKAKRSPRRRS